MKWEWIELPSILKRKNKNFTAEEMKSFLNVIRADELEDKILAKLSIEDEKDGIISEEKKRVTRCKLTLLTLQLSRYGN